MRGALLVENEDGAILLAECGSHAADAALIAAAPDMAEALCELINTLTDKRIKGRVIMPALMNAWCEPGRVALAKARGESA